MTTSDKALQLKADFQAIVADIERRLAFAPVVPVQSWQSTKAPQGMPEILNYSLSYDLRGVQMLEPFREAIGPNLPWADNHFTTERISGHPINPGTTWRQWPYSRSADKHRREGEEDPQFDHSYAERYWPKYAGMTEGGLLDFITVHTAGPDGESASERVAKIALEGDGGHMGIRFRYGDLSDLVELMAKDPLTRQAFLPIWFPEDLTAANEGKRVPCTLGYHFILRDGKLHCTYYIRSCDYVRHFRDDVYLTIRLLLFVLNVLTMKNPEVFRKVDPGIFTMHIVSLHCFELDQKNLKLKFD